jgi:isopentenyl-diphosphate delta-isomerase
LNEAGVSARAEQVSFESDELILVDERDTEIGSMSKAECHNNAGVLHRAFSLFIFNDEGKLLIQQRNSGKRLWPLYWSNTCCSHPRTGESMEDAVHRRLEQELGMSSEFTYLYKFQYQAEFGELGSENELCWVFIGFSSDPVKANENEIAATRFISPEELDRELESYPDRFTPWFKMEWLRLRQDFAEALRRATQV